MKYLKHETPMQVQAKNPLRLIIHRIRVDYFATLVYLHCLYFQDGFLGVGETLCDGSMEEVLKCVEYDYVTGIIK